MRILGIDPALTITGYGAIEAFPKGLKLLEAGVIRTSSLDGDPERLRTIFSAVGDLIREIRPDCVVLEKIYAHYRHPTTSYILGQARGVICLACALENVQLAEYAATRVKKACIGQGLAPKYQVQRMVVSTLGLKTVPKYNDVTDALALAIAHSHIMRSKF